MAIDRDAIGWFLNQAGRIPLLTHEEELLHGRAIQDWIAIRDHADPTPAQRRVIRRGQRSYERMFNANLRLVVNVAKKYTRIARHLDLSDLVQEGSIGLARAVEKFDPSRGYKFSTYAYWWIRQGISRGISQTDRTIRLPVNAIECLNRIRMWAPGFAAEHGRVPTFAECAEYCGIQPHIMRGYMEHTNGVTSLDGALRGAEDMSILDTVAADMPDAYEDLEIADGLTKVTGWMSGLSEYQHDVITLRYGLNGQLPKSQSDVGRELGISRQAIQQTERAAMLRLRLTANKTRQAA